MNRRYPFIQVIKGNSARRSEPKLWQVRKQPKAQGINKEAVIIKCKISAQKCVRKNYENGQDPEAHRLQVEDWFEIHPSNSE